VRAAYALATEENVQLSYSHLQTVLDPGTEFETDFRGAVDDSEEEDDDKEEDDDEEDDEIYILKRKWEPGVALGGNSE